jgi:D-3-phosphoglycerate dehydrogenase
LAGDLVPDAVNVAGGNIDDSVKPGISLAEKLGQVLFGMADASLVSVEVEVRGEIAVHDVSVLKLAALKGVFQNAVSEQVSYVNAPLLAEARGVEVKLTVERQSEEYRNMTTVRAVLSDGNVISVSGTVIGPKLHEKIVNINGYDVELSFAEHLVLMVYSDRPGIVAIYGKAFADAKVNIAAMQIARQQKGGKALSVITVDSPIDQKVLDKLKKDIDASTMKAITVVSS